ncbi:hypothetical protein evm_013744 [Chilo suppressalis]|nr:hypothetical protein evm_013744 [Chilo suppressalis]
MNWLKLLTTIWLSTANGNPLKYRPVINIADIAKYSEVSDNNSDFSPLKLNVPVKNSEIVMKCVPVSFEVKDNVGRTLHGKLKTTCIPVDANSLRESDSDMANYDRGGSTTTSTMAPYLDATATSTTKKSDDNVYKMCDNVAVCREHRW